MEVNCRIESESDLRKALDELYILSKEGKSFNGLYELISSEHTIITAIHDIKSNKGSKTPGIDGRNIDYYLQMPREDLIELIQKKMSYYNPMPVKRKYIPKSNGKQRPLGIPTIIDRIIQQCVKIVIEPIVEAKFYSHSYGFRPMRSAHHAISRIAHLMNMGRYQFVIEGDIKGYFDNIDHAILKRKIRKMGIIDKRVIALIDKMLKAGVMDDNNFSETSFGSPQGGIISPLLANIYLNDFDWTIASRYDKPYFRNEYASDKNARRKYKKLGRKPIFIVRYADDWVIFTQTLEQAEVYLKKIRRYFKSKLKLELSEDKTVITDLSKNFMKFLGFQIKFGKPRLNKTRTGNPKRHSNSAMIFPDVKKLREKNKDIIRDIKALKKITCEYTMAKEIELINSRIIGLAEYFKIAICSKLYDSLDNILFRTSHYVWKYRFRNKNGGKNKDYVRKLNELGNRVSRHSKHESKTHAIEVERIWIGITKYSLTNSVNPTNFNQKMTPYTEEGRKLYEREKKKRRSLDRPPLYIKNIDILRLAKANLKSRNKKINKYNFEYYMNREYAFNRDKGKCRVCDVDILPMDLHTHHINPKLNLDRINKVVNLASVHKWCHELIHSTTKVNDGKMQKKIDNFRNKLQSGNAENSLHLGK